MGFITITKYLNTDVAARVAPTEMTDVVAAVVMIVVVGIGTSMSVNGILTICASGGSGGGASPRPRRDERAGWQQHAAC